MGNFFGLIKIREMGMVVLAEGDWLQLMHWIWVVPSNLEIF